MTVATHPELASSLGEILALLRREQQVPWESVLWDADDIASHLKVSARTVGEKYAPLPGFPRPTRLGGGVRRWYAHEILTWVESTRQARPRASRAN